MNKKWIYWLSAMVMVWSFFTGPLGWTQPKPETKGPSITHAFAVEKVRYGDILKIYIEADDPDGDMLKIATVVDQVGYGHYPTDWIYLKPQNRNHLIGYLQWNTFSSNASRIREWTHITLRVSVFDKSGNESNEVVIPLEFVSGGSSNSQPPGPFNQGKIPMLGHINIDLFEPTQMGNGGHGLRNN
jgi:hypothetical protein